MRCHKIESTQRPNLVAKGTGSGLTTITSAGVRCYLRFLAGVGVWSAMQLAMNASQAPRRISSRACWAFLKQKSSSSLGAARLGSALTRVTKATNNNVRLGFITFIAKFPILIINASFARALNAVDALVHSYSLVLRFSSADSRPPEPSPLPFSAYSL